MGRFRMKYLAAYCLAALSGKKPSADDLKKILTSVGVEVDSEKLNTVVASLKDKELHEVIAAGLTKVGSLSFGGGAGSSAGNNVAKDEPKKEEKKVEVEEEEEVDFGAGGLFGDDF